MVPKLHADGAGMPIFATVYNWRRAERLARGEIRGVQPGETPEQAITRLTRELQELHEANYILRKALGFMAGR